MLDTNSEFGAMAEKMLQEELVIWLTTVRADGTPQPNPVWFFWDQEAIILYTQPSSLKLKNISRNPHVSLNLNTDRYGSHVVVLTGKAEVDQNTPPASQHAAYLSKYRNEIADLHMNPQEFIASYSVTIRIHPDRIRGY